MPWLWLEVGWGTDRRDFLRVWIGVQRCAPEMHMGYRLKYGKHCNGEDNCWMESVTERYVSNRLDLLVSPCFITYQTKEVKPFLLYGKYFSMYCVLRFLCWEETWKKYLEILKCSLCILADPYQGEFPETIEEYLHHGTMKCIAFNRKGTLLAGNYPSLFLYK